MMPNEVRTWVSIGARTATALAVAMTTSSVA